MCQLPYLDCNQKYIGQTGRDFHIRFQEHFRDYKYRNSKPKFARHVLENKHSICPKENIMDILTRAKW